MTFEQYKAKKQQGESFFTEDGKIGGENPYKITCREQYEEVMEAVHEYRQNPINFEFSEEDFDLFEKSWKELDDWLHYVDPDDENSVCDLDEIVEMMHKDNWTWACHEVTKEEFMQAVRDHYETCLKANSPVYTCSSGGITITIDVEEHSINFSFNYKEALACPDGIY